MTWIRLVAAFHKCLGEKASVYLRDHNAALCPVCQKEQSKSPKTKNKTGTDINGHAEGPEKSDIFGKIGWVIWVFVQSWTNLYSFTAR